MMVYNNFDDQNLLFICSQISPQIFAILQNFPINNLRDQQFCTLLCELERLVVVLFTGNALEVEVPPGMVCQVNVWVTTNQTRKFLTARQTTVLPVAAKSQSRKSSSSSEGSS